MITVGIGAMIGACIRVFLSQYNGKFPWMTLFINTVGSLLLGIFVSADHYLFLGTGMMGGLTTFSTFSVEAVMLLRTHLMIGILYIILSIALPLLYFVIGMQF